MTTDLAMLREAEEGKTPFRARIYQWDGVWVSLGRFQVPERALNLEECERLNVRWVMRPTGGKGVLHGNDMTVSIACSLAFLASEEPNVHAAYQALAPAIVTALQASGLNAALGEDTDYAVKNAPDADCFAHVSPNDICDADSGLKLAGTALRVTRTGVLLQASIPLGPYPVDPAAIYRGEAVAEVPPTIDASVIRQELFSALEQSEKRSLAKGAPLPAGKVHRNLQ